MDLYKQKLVVFYGPLYKTSPNSVFNDLYEENLTMFMDLCIKPLPIRCFMDVFTNLVPIIYFMDLCVLWMTLFSLPGH